MSSLVSVIIPSYDRPLLLKTRSIPSVLAQRYANWELIVVGDGPSGSELRTAVESFGDRRMRYTEIPRPDYSGLSAEERWHAAGAAARNHGLSQATGQIIAPLDDDDEFLPGHLEDCVGAIAQQNRDFVYGYTVTRDFETGVDQCEDWYSWNEPETERMFLERNIIFHSTVVYTKPYASLRYPTDGRAPADYALWRAIHAEGARFGSVDRPQAIYYGESTQARVRLSVPTLPPLEVLAEQLAGIAKSRTLSNVGPFCARLEEAIGQRLGLPRVIATSSGDSGLMLALRALRLRHGGRRSRVVMPSYAHPSLANAVVWNGFTPLFCDIDPATLCVTRATIEPCLSDDVAAIAVLHPHGHPCDMPAIAGLARSAGIPLLADAAAAFGAEVGGRPVGTWGDVEVFSMSGTKTLTAGEGGLVCSRDEELLRLGRRAARYGLADDYSVDWPGFNAKLAELPASIALASLPFVDGWLAHRRRVEADYRTRLADVPGVRFPAPAAASARSGCKDAVLILDSPAAARRLRDRLAAYRIESRPYYRPLHRMSAYAGMPHGGLSGTEAVADATLCVPLYNDIRDEVVSFVCEVVRETMM